MIKRKILLVVALYIILAVVGYFNFGFHDLMIEKLGGKCRPNGSAWKKLEKNMKNIQTGVLRESRDESSDQEADH